MKAVAHYNDASILATVSEGLGDAMVGITDLKNDKVNFRDREGGNSTESHLYGSSWKR